MTTLEIFIEVIGWISTILFLYSIVASKRVRLHQIGIAASITTGLYAYAHGATAIWVKWLIAFFFHSYMAYKGERENAAQIKSRGVDI